MNNTDDLDPREILLTSAISTKFCQVLDEAIDIGAAFGIGVTPKIVAGAIRATVMHVEVNMISNTEVARVLREGLISLLQTPGHVLYEQSQNSENVTKIKQALGEKFAQIFGDEEQQSPVPRNSAKKVLPN